MIFSVLCLTLYSGGEDCSYTWTQIPQDQLLVMYYSAGGTNKYTDFYPLQGFTSYDDKKIYFNEGVGFNVIEHEIKHGTCHLEYEKSGVEHPYCDGHFEIIK